MSEESEESDEVIEVPCAAHIELESCPPDCDCQRVHVVLCDAEGDPFAAAQLTPDNARALARRLGSKADIAEAQQRRIEGRLS